MENIYEFLRLWFAVWLLFRCYEFIVRDCAKISAAIRRRNE